MTSKLEQFMGQSSVSPVYVQNGNSPWAQRYAQELRDVVSRYAARLPRSLQRHLGPSELGHRCDRQLVGKMAGVDFGSGAGNLMHDPWPSIVGTAIHAFLEKAFGWEASQGRDIGRWLPETRVTPDPAAVSPHPGTADLYDVLYKAVIDHKCQSDPIRTRLRREGPPYHYYIQMLLYAVGYMHLGYQVDRIVLASWPRTGSQLSGLYIWEHVITDWDLKEVLEVLRKTAIREQLAVMVVAGSVSFWDIPATPSYDDCQWCPFYNAAVQADRDPKGCAGLSLTKPSGKFSTA